MKHTYNLFNPLDYLRLLYLAFFRFFSFPQPSERHQQVILSIQGFVIIIGINTLVGWLTNWGGDLQQFVIYVAFGVAFGVAGGVAVGVLEGEAFGVAGGVAFSVAGGVAFSVAGGVAFSVAGGVAAGVAFGVAAGVAFGVAGGVAAGVAFDVAGGVAIGVAGGVAFGVALGVAGGVAFGVAVDLLGTFGAFWGPIAGLGVVLIGSLISFWISLFIGGIFLLLIEIPETDSALLHWLSGIVVLTFFSIGTGYLFPFLARWIPALGGLEPFWIAILFFLAFSRLPLWPIEAFIGMMGYAVGMRSKDPETLFNAIQNWYFDHHTFLPLPFESRALRRLGALNQNKGIEGAITMAQYSGHILEAVHALKFFACQDPYEVQAHIVRLDDGDARDRLFQFTFHKQPEAIVRARSAYRILITLSNDFSAKQRPKEHPKPMLGLMRDLLENSSKTETLTLEHIQTELHRSLEEMRLANRLAGENGIRQGNEMVDLYSAILTAIQWSEVAQVSEFKAPELPVDDSPVLFSEKVATLLSGMNEIAQTIQGFNQSTSQVTRQNALLQANEQLTALEDQAENAPPPAGPLLAMVIAHWGRLIASAGGELSRTQAHEPVPNPYVIANPVRGDLFVGRQDIMTRLEELWGGRGQKPSVVLFGHRRMGKSSILHNIGARFGAHTLIVDFNTQREGMVNNTAELLYNLTMAIFDSLPIPMKENLEGGEPDEESFSQHNPHTAFNRFLKRLNRARGETRLIITVDEFELLEDLIARGKLEPSLLDFWRSLIQTYPWFIMAFAGLHTLQEMTEDYWHPLYASVLAEPVSFLSPKAAYRLITQPTPDFPLDYDKEAADRIIALTNGQPYLTQLICHGLVTRFNRETFEEGKERERRFSLEDVEAVINAPEFFRDGNAYFTGVWVQAERSGPPEQTNVLKALSLSDQGMNVKEISEHTPCNTETLQNALDALFAHDVVQKTEERWDFTVELMRRWVRKKEVDK